MPHKLPHLLSKIPIIGIFCFILLFLYSTSLYPGGSQANIQTVGFDWMNNYWCNLMNEKGMNGMPNPARPIAISAMIILCSSLSIFFYLFATFFAQSPLCKFLIKFGGSFSMFFAIFIFTVYHDSMIILSSLFGVLAVIGILKEVYRSQLVFYKKLVFFVFFY